MSDRRAFLRRLALTAAGLYVGADLLEETTRRIFPVGIDLKPNWRPTLTDRQGYLFTLDSPIHVVWSPRSLVTNAIGRVTHVSERSYTVEWGR